jgi:hypothetical protein
MLLRVSVVILFLQFIRSELQLKKNMVFDVVAVVSTVHIGNILYCLYVLTLREDLEQTMKLFVRCVAVRPSLYSFPLRNRNIY